MGMARVEKAKISTKLGVPSIDESPSTMRINLKRHKGMDVGNVGHKINFSGHGKIVGIHKDSFGHHMNIDVHHIEKQGS